MNKPTITIDGKEIPMKTKARMWRTVTEFQLNHEDGKPENLVEEYCEVIAAAYGVPVEEVLDNMELEDVIPTYRAIAEIVNKGLTAKLPKKNETATEQQI